MIIAMQAAAIALPSRSSTSSRRVESSSSSCNSICLISPSLYSSSYLIEERRYFEMCPVSSEHIAHVAFHDGHQFHQSVSGHLQFPVHHNQFTDSLTLLSLLHPLSLTASHRKSSRMPFSMSSSVPTSSSSSNSPSALALLTSVSTSKSSIWSRICSTSEVNRVSESFSASTCNSFIFPFFRQSLFVGVSERKWCYAFY